MLGHPLLVSGAIVYWVCFLWKSDAFFQSWLVVGLLAEILLLWSRRLTLRRELTRSERAWGAFLIGLFTLLTILANYDILCGAHVTTPAAVITSSVDTMLDILFLVTSIQVYKIIVRLGYQAFLLRLPAGGEDDPRQGVSSSCGRQALNHPNATIKLSAWTPLKVFITVWVALATLYLAVLFIGCYPGTLTNDSIDQILQVLFGHYSNHHPYFHTLLIGIFLRLGMGLFGSVSAGAATFLTFQCIVMAAIFAFTLKTMYEMGASRSALVFALCWFAFHPCNLLYASTMWKDVLFGGMVLLFVTSLYRVRTDLGPFRLNITLVVLSSLCFCVFRSNGIVAFALFVLLMLIAFGVRTKNGRTPRHVWSIAAATILPLLLSLILLGPVLNVLEVSRDTPVESLSIPAQQIARVIAEGNTLSEGDRALLDQVIDVDAVPTEYVPYISDPIKSMIRRHDGSLAIEANPRAYLGLYLRLGFEHPISYLKAWVDQTRGYWSAGYPFWTTAYGVARPTLGLTWAPFSSRAGELVKAAAGLSEDASSPSPVVLLFCTGLYVWTLITLAVFNVMVRREGAIEVVAVLLIVATLLIATPVFNEFRYAYPVYTCLPFLLASTGMLRMSSPRRLAAS